MSVDLKAKSVDVVSRAVIRDLDTASPPRRECTTPSQHNLRPDTLLHSSNAVAEAPHHAHDPMPVPTVAGVHAHHTVLRRSNLPSRRLLHPLLLPRLERLLSITPDHDHTEEAADDRAAEQQEDDGDADGPDAGREEGLQGMVGVDEGLAQKRVSGVGSGSREDLIGEGRVTGVGVTLCCVGDIPEEASRWCSRGRRPRRRRASRRRSAGRAVDN
ncbi:hypothetical protein LTR53_008687 [Teratosphaeriaceae sp. CCFEE 6253]|nr:hypothetical protein LTR53_008687 [Teratosphaeriaceae sp. CCFEE 6253]